MFFKKELWLEIIYIFSFWKYVILILHYYTNQKYIIPETRYYHLMPKLEIVLEVREDAPRALNAKGNKKYFPTFFKCGVIADRIK
jgi:hypothetical protein